jgi:Core-2/I-Branching enzyme
VKVAYVVLSHRSPGQVLRLVRALAEGPAARVLVRHDPRGPRLAAGDVRAAGGEPLEDRIEFEWGGWSQLELIFACLRAAAARHDPDWTLVLSGQDYPLRALAAIEAELESSGADGRLGAVREVERRRPAPGADEFFLRCRYLHYTRPRAMPHLPAALRPLAYVRELPPLVGVRRPPWPPPPLDFYASADWLTLGRRALAAVLRAGEDRRLMRHFRRVAVPSESFFASVLLNDPGLTIERDNRRFAPFSRPGAPHPDTLTSADLERLLASGADFGRKFDAEVDSRVLDLLDERRHSSSG